ncbi:MAG TPA: thioredoxin domain-containing protein, partial [Polyangiaceae bacterium]
LLPAIWAVLQPSPPVPPEIASLWAPGKLNVVEFVDFQCPFCRQQHPRLVEVLEDYRGRVHFVRLNMPLASHSQARHAARAYCCAEDQGKGPEMADALFAAESLTPEACEKLAASLGLVMPSYRTCVVSPSTDARIDEQIRIVRSAGLAGLPTLWIGDKLLIGLQPIDTLRQAFVDATRSGTSRRLPTAVLWAAFAATLAVVGALAIRLPRRRAEGRTD